MRTPIKIAREASPIVIDNQSLLAEIYPEDIIPDDHVEFEEFGLKTNKLLKNFDCFEDSKSPEEWLQICKNSSVPNGFCPFYIENKYIWQEVEVLDYDVESKKFKIKSYSSG